MPIIIRTKMMETNSSSSHSLAIDSSVRTYRSITPDEDGIITLEGGQFGWSWEKFTDPLTKANYCAVDAGSNQEKLDMLIEVIKEHTGAKEVILDFSDDYDHNWSYIDHESMGTSNEVFEDKRKLKEFIFGGGVLYTGNDNDYAPPNFYDLGKKYDFKLTLEGVDLEHKITKDESRDVEFIREALITLYEEHPLVWRANINSSREEYSIPYNNTDNPAVNMNNKTLRVEQSESIWEGTGKEREYKGQKIIDTKYLKWSIQKIND